MDTKFVFSVFLGIIVFVAYNFIFGIFQLSYSVSFFILLYSQLAFSELLKRFVVKSKKWCGVFQKYSGRLLEFTDSFNKGSFLVSLPIVVLLAFGFLNQENFQGLFLGLESLLGFVSFFLIGLIIINLYFLLIFLPVYSPIKPKH